MNKPQTLADSTREKIFIVAEIGKNFIQTKEDRPVAEYLENAKRLVRAARTAGADAVKFQTHCVEDEIANIAFDAPHFKGQDRYAWVSRNAAATPVETFWRPLKQFCDKEGIVFFSTPMSRGAARYLTKVGVPFWKVGSGDLLDFVMLDYLVLTRTPIILSAGMSTLEEVDAAVDFLKRRGAEIALLHCVSKYPCPPEDLHLRTISFFQERYHIPIGFSDHSLGIDSALAAAALGSRIIEKHFSFSRELWGSDHKVSLVPDEFAALVRGIRDVEYDPEKAHEYLERKDVAAGLGAPMKVLEEGEKEFRPFFRKTLVAARSIPAGTVFTPDMVYAMRPQQLLPGIPSEHYESVLGRRSVQDLKQYDPIQEYSLSKVSLRGA